MHTGLASTTIERLCRILVAVFNIASLIPFVVGAEEPHVLTVCDILKDLRPYSGKRVAVRGIVYQSREIFALGGLGCSQAFMTDGFTWPTALSLEAADYEEPGERRVAFQTDEAALSALTEVLRGRANQGSRRQEVWATFVGQIRVRGEYTIETVGNGRRQGNGYGDLAAYPAQLVIQTVRDVSLIEPGK